MLTGRQRLMIGIIVVSSALPAWAAAAQSAPTISAEPVPGQLEVMQGTAIKLGGMPTAEGPQPESYHWEIVQGEGGALYNEDQYQVIFQSPRIENEIELFVIRLTVGYAGQQSAHATAHIRVHRDMPRAEPEPKKPNIEDVMADFYRRENDAREANRQRLEESRPRVVSQYTYTGFVGGFGYRGPGWGWGYGWGWPAAYPIYAPIVVPPPGIEWGPGEGSWGEPIAIPYDDMVTTFPEEIAEDYLPQDYPGADAVPEMGHAGASPADFINVPTGVWGAGGGQGSESGPDGGIDFAEPLVDPAFSFDDFGW